MFNFKLLTRRMILNNKYFEKLSIDKYLELQRKYDLTKEEETIMKHIEYCFGDEGKI